ncbi:MAG: Flp pilus assembly protein CpaB [Oscillospiraceae bacterium]|nr:Flp pilus assembly protein CpaB [Oscillospiraceae bacterium]
MKLLKNRTVLGVICIALSLIICFAITPLFNAAKDQTTEIVRMKKDIKIGQEITAKDIEVVEVGAYNLPSEVIRSSEEVVGKYVSSELLKGEYVLPSKISDTPASENAYLYNLTGEKRAISVTIPSFAGGLSGKLISGDIVSVIAVDFREKGETVVPDELQYVEVIAVTDKEGYDEGEVVVTADGEEEADLPETVTLLVTPDQASILAELEAEGEIHISLVYRGTADNAQKFIAAQEKLLSELAEAEKAEEKTEKVEDMTVPAEPTDEEIIEPADTEIEEIPTEENSPVIDTVIINTPEEPETTDSTETVETEVTTDGESV